MLEREDDIREDALQADVAEVTHGEDAATTSLVVKKHSGGQVLLVSALEWSQHLALLALRIAILVMLAIKCVN